MDEYEQTQEMKARMADLKAKMSAAMMAAALFGAALYDELGADDATEYVARELARINQRLGEDYTRLFELEAQLY